MHDTTISTKDFQMLAGIVYQETGISLSDNKVDLVKARIAKRMRTTRIPSLKEYINVIENDASEFCCFIDAMTTNHTYFFRENKHIEYMVENLPLGPKHRIWCAACSSGEEPYSMAIQLAEAGRKFEIHASDISDTMLETASKGIYPKDRTRCVPVPLVRRYFQQGQNKWNGYYKVKKELRENISFFKYNLISGPPRDEYDVIFCRNVMIYFDHATRQHVVNKLYQSLRPGGLFAIGQSESLVGVEHPFKYLRPSIYCK
ncbi:CheR family methyltransferase [Desulfatibacillum alkenivorans]|jgi:chemotaxis protein methyltransferase CheR|nr:protein-glutamate O-methyltransferase CheR [Desulfatibacillum alkenivorans]